MAAAKRNISFSNTCDYCGNEFSSAMPFAKFCSNNHRKYFANEKARFEIELNEHLVDEAEMLIDELTQIIESMRVKPNNPLFLKKITKKILLAAERMETNRKVKERIDCMTRLKIQKKRKKGK